MTSLRFCCMLLVFLAAAHAGAQAGVRLSENFESVIPPALPPGWVATNAVGPDPLWVTVQPVGHAGFAALVDDPTGVISDKRLDSPLIALTTNGAILKFQHEWNFNRYMDDAWDGGVLEISIDGAPFQDILDAGGTVLQFGPDCTILGVGNPLLGRTGWGKYSVATSILRLPPVAGSNVVLRWRMGSSLEDTGHTGLHWWIDDIQLCDGFHCDAIPLPRRLALDTSGNGIFEPGEAVDVAPYYFNNTGSILDLTGVATSFGGPGPPDLYKLNGASADYGSINPGALGSCFFTASCYNLQIENTGSRPVQHWDAQMGETVSTGASATWALHVGGSFADVPSSNIFYSNIETVLHRRVTGGCGGENYCPDSPALRKQMAVFLLKASRGAAYMPPAAVGIFADVPASDPFAPWIEDLYNRGITGGCLASPLKYCPDQTVLRCQMAVFLLKTQNGAVYVPPACKGVFSDVACPSTYADWIEDLAVRQITAGCGNGNFCPNNPNTRGQMAVFVVKTFALKLYWP